MERGVGLFQQLILSTQVQNWGYLWMFQQLCNMQNQSHIFHYSQQKLIEHGGRGGPFLFKDSA